MPRYRRTLIACSVVPVFVAGVSWAAEDDPTPIGCLQSGIICSGLVVPGEQAIPDEPDYLPEGVEICEGTQEEQLAAGCRPIEEFLVPGRRGTPEVTAEMALDVVALPEADIVIDPNVLGLTGLLTTFSTSGVEPVTSRSSVRGYSIEATATPVAYHWDFGDDQGKSGQVVSHVYETRNSYQVVLTVTYSGSYQWEGNGRSGSGELGSVTSSTTRDYRVVEARGVLGPVN